MKTMNELLMSLIKKEKNKKNEKVYKYEKKDVRVPIIDAIIFCKFEKNKIFYFEWLNTYNDKYYPIDHGDAIIEVLKMYNMSYNWIMILFIHTQNFKLLFVTQKN